AGRRDRSEGPQANPPRGLFGTLVFRPAMGATLFGSVSRTRRRKVRPQSSRERETPMAQTLQLNKPAPEFTLPDGNRTKVNLKDFRGKSVVLAFYPADWSPVCTNELAIIQETLEDIRGYNAEVLAISVDNVWSHKA